MRGIFADALVPAERERELRQGERWLDDAEGQHGREASQLPRAALPDVRDPARRVAPVVAMRGRDEKVRE